MIPKVTYPFFREICWTSVSHSGHTVGLSLTDNFDLEKLHHCRNPKQWLLRGTHAFSWIYFLLQDGQQILKKKELCKDTCVFLPIRWLMSLGTCGLFKDLTSEFERGAAQRLETRKEERCLLFASAFWSLAWRWHEKLRSVHWTEDQRSVPCLLPPSNPEPSRLSSVCFSTCSFDSPVCTSVLHVCSRCCRCEAASAVFCASVVSKTRTDRLFRANGWELVLNKIKKNFPHSWRIMKGQAGCRYRKLLLSRHLVSFCPRNCFFFYQGIHHNSPIWGFDAESKIILWALAADRQIWGCFDGEYSVLRNFQYTRQGNHTQPALY